MSDLTAPSLRLVNDTGNVSEVTSDPTVAVEGTLVAGAIWQYQVRERNEEFGEFIDDWSDWRVVPSSGQVGIESNTDGLKRVRARQLLSIPGQKDQVSDNSINLNFTLLRDLPATPGLRLRNDTGSTALITSDGRIEVEGLGKNNLWEYRFADTDWLTGEGSQIQTLRDGLKRVFVRQIDGAGNRSASSDALEFTLDTTAPEPTRLRLRNDTGREPFLTSDGHVMVEGLEDEASWEFRTRIDASDWGLPQPGIGSEVQLADATDGRRRVQVRQSDRAGNRSEWSEILDFTLLTKGPQQPTLALRNDTGTTTGVTRDGRVQLTGGDRNTRLQVQINGSDWEDRDSNQLDLTNEGSNVILARLVDGAGNVSLPSDPLKFELDTETPTAPRLRLAKDTGREAGLTRRGVVRIGRLEAGAAWEYRLLREDGWSDDWQQGSGGRINLGLGLDDGRRGLRVRQIDGAGNLSDSEELRFTLKTQISPLRINSIGTGSGNNITAVRGGNRIAGSAEPRTDIILQLGKQRLGRVQSNSNGEWSYNLDEATISELGQGRFRQANSLIARQVDGAGNRNNSRSEVQIQTTVSSPERDRLIGNANSRNTFRIREASDSLIRNFDTIVNYQSRDRINIGGQRYGSKLTNSIRSVATLGDMARFLNVQRPLGPREVVAFKVDQPQFQGGTFLAASTGRTGLQSDQDIVLFLANFNIDRGGNSVTFL